MNFLNRINNKFKRKLIEHNKELFIKKKSNKKILLEFNAFHSTHIAFSYLSNALSKKYDAQILPFFNYSIISAPLFPNMKDKIKWYLSKKFSLFNHGIYKSFGSSECFKPNIKKKNINASIKFLEAVFKKIKKKEQILSLRYKGILVGDILYDTYLKSKNLPTIDLKSTSFMIHCENFISLCDFWIDYFSLNKIEAIITSHSVYSYAIPIRVAIKKKIKAFACTSRHLYKLDKNEPRMHANTKEYKKIYEKLNPELKSFGIKASKKILENRVKGKTDTASGFFGNVKISPFNKKKFDVKINKNKKVKILILPHDFYDAVHIYGNGLFPDLYEWLIFLGEFSKKNYQYDWYIKLRGDYRGKYKISHNRTANIIFDYLKKYPNLKILPNNFSLFQIKKQKIDFVLTVHGTAALEFPLIDGPTVINASPNNPHARYNFSITPKTIGQYKNILNNLKKLKDTKKKKINKNEIYQYYFMRHIYNDKNWLIDQNKLMNFLGIWQDQFTEKFYKYWLQNFSMKRHNDILKKIELYLNSNDRTMNIKFRKTI